MSRLLKAHQPCNDCGSSDALAIFENGTYCYSCGYGTRKHTKGATIEPEIAPPKELPEDCGYEYSDAALRWVVKAGLLGLYEKYSILYSGIWNRVIIPSYFRGELLGWQGRAVDEGQNPKYIQGSGQKPHAFVSKSAEDGAPFVVLVEDAASAMCLGEYVPTIAIMGTSLDSSGKQIALLTSITDRFILCLDSDRAGQDAARKLEKRLSLVGEVLENITFPRDLKYMDKDKLQAIGETILTKHGHD